MKEKIRQKGGSKGEMTANNKGENKRGRRNKKGVGKQSSGTKDDGKNEQEGGM